MIKDTGVTVVSLHPGVVSTEIMRFDQKTSWVMWFINIWAWGYFRLFGLSAVKGAMTSVHCATDNDVINHNGGYFV